MRVAYLGNFSVSYSTETHVAASIEALGHEVLRLQEGSLTPRQISDASFQYDADMFLWTQTLGLAQTGGTQEERFEMLKRIRIPTVGFHLDRWWGLERESHIWTEPFFKCDYLFTADGGHDEGWKNAGINHHWLPPGVFHEEAYDGTFRKEYRCDVVFVGSWRHYGHEEWWPTRQRMLQRLDQRFHSRFRKFPLRQAIRGHDLTDLYASCKVVAGDSCLVGNPARYWSDRVPETTGRGGLLVHPDVEGIRDVHPHLPVFQSGNFDEMVGIVDHFLKDDGAREESRKLNAEHTRTHHTYRNRMEAIFSKVFA